MSSKQMLVVFIVLVLIERNVSGKNDCVSVGHLVGKVIHSKTLFQTKWLL